MEETTIKTLEQVIARNDYKRISASLKEKTQELARLIGKKMIELDVEELMGYELRAYRGRMSVDKFLMLFSEDDGRYHLLEAFNSDYHLCAENGSYVRCATSSEALAFLNKARTIIAELDRIETEKTVEIQAALDSTTDL